MAYDDRELEKLKKQQETWQRSDALERADAVQAMMQHKATRSYLHWLLEITKAIGVNPFTANALTTAFMCGEQNVGQQVMSHLLEHVPDEFTAMLKEKADVRRERESIERTLAAATRAGAVTAAVGGYGPFDLGQLGPDGYLVGDGADTG